MGINEYEKKNWKVAVEFFEDVLTRDEKILMKARLSMDLEFSKLKPFSFPPFTQKINNRLLLLSAALNEEDYSDFCAYLLEIQKLSFYSTIVFVGIVSLLAFSLLIILIIYRKKAELEPFARLKKIKERLGMK